MQNEEKLLKQMDALTMNARQVINAQIRSTIKAGSYNGFTVTRAGQQLVLDRGDIYRLYKFYEDWEYRSGTETPFGVVAATDGSAGSPISAADFKALAEANDIQIGTGNGHTTWDVLVTHAKILFMNDTNSDKTDDEWVDMIRTASNPKLITNSAPIPLNLRAPIYDENLSTKHYSQYETYLFPFGYNSIDLLGFAGDGMTHVAGGKTWNFDIDESFIVTSEKYLFGRHGDETDKNYPYGQPYPDRFAFMFGTDCYAYGRNSLAGGWDSVAYMGNAFSYGHGGVAFAANSALVGNLLGYAGGETAFGAGSYINAMGYCGAALNMMTQSGGFRYNFTTFADDEDDGTAESGTTCRSMITVDGCTYTRATGSTVSKSGLAANQIRIPKSALHSGSVFFDFGVGDKVCLYDWDIVGKDGRTESHTADDAFVIKPVITEVTGISHNANGDCIVSLATNITNLEGKAIAGGSVCVCGYHRTGMGPYNPMNWLVSGASSDVTYYINAGDYSTALNYYTTAKGIAQTVVGARNIPLTEPRFMVGCGYINSLWPSEKNDFGNLAGEYENCFVAGPRYSFMKIANSRVVLGVSDHRNSDQLPASGPTTVVAKDEVARYGVYQLTGAYAVAWDTDMKVRGLSHVCYDRGEFSVNDDGLVVHPIPKGDRSGSYEMGYRDISTRLGGSHGSTVIWSGKDPDKDQMMWERYQYIQARGAGTSAFNRVHIYGEDGITVETPRTIKMIARHSDDSLTSYIDMDFERLILSGQTYGALPATCDARSFNLRGDMVFANPKYMAHNRMSHSGFFYDWADGYLPNEGLPKKVRHWSSYCDAYHSFTSSYVYSTDFPHFTTEHSATQSKHAYDVSGFILPGALKRKVMTVGSDDVLPRVMFYSNTIFGDGNSNVDPAGPVMCEELAYMRDVDRAVASAVKERVGTGTYCRTETVNSKLVVKTDSTTAAQTIDAYCYDNSNGAIKKTLSGQFTKPWLNGALAAQYYQQLGQLSVSAPYWSTVACGFIVPWGAIGMPLLDRLSIVLTGHTLSISFGLNLRFLKVYCGDAYPASSVGLRLPIYPSIGLPKYLNDSFRVVQLTANGPYGYRTNMTATANFPNDTGVMLLDIQWTRQNPGDLLVPITLSGPCAFEPFSAGTEFYDAHHPSALNYWDGKAALTPDYIKNSFKVIA